MKLLDKAPATLMIVETDDNTDPYNSGVHKILPVDALMFIQDRRTVIGDMSTAVKAFYARR